MNRSFVGRKLFSIQHRINKRIYGNRVNLPYLSGDGFESICDFSVFSPRASLRKNVDLPSARSIFCRSDNIEKFIQDFGGKISASVLVLGNSDRDFYDFNVQLPSSIKRVYLQNSHISNHFYQTLPIGLENLRFARNGIPSLLESADLTKLKQLRLLVGPFSPTHVERLELQKWKGLKHELISFEENYLSPKKLTEVSAGYLFVACPRGNGTDTHRFWETLYRGSIPVVKRSKWSESIKNLGIPIIQLSNWDFEEFESVVASQTFIPFDPYSMKELWLDTWKKLFHS